MPKAYDSIENCFQPNLGRKEGHFAVCLHCRVFISTIVVYQKYMLKVSLKGYIPEMFNAFPRYCDPK